MLDEFNMIMSSRMLQHHTTSPHVVLRCTGGLQSLCVCVLCLARHLRPQCVFVHSTALQQLYICPVGFAVHAATTILYQLMRFNNPHVCVCTSVYQPHLRQTSSSLARPSCVCCGPMGRSERDGELGVCHKLVVHII